MAMYLEQNITYYKRMIFINKFWFKPELFSSCLCITTSIPECFIEQDLFIINYIVVYFLLEIKIL